MQKNLALIKNNISAYYAEKFNFYGDTPRGVDWNGKESQFLRFDQLCKVIGNFKKPFSLIDFGCGYGALYEYLVNYSEEFTYTGVDISNEILLCAKNKFGHIPGVKFSTTLNSADRVDFVVASGVFNVRLGYDDDDWFNYVLLTLDSLNQSCIQGFSFNCLTIFSDVDKMQPSLYYADPMRIFNHCKMHYSKNVALLHDYDLYEFTILVRKMA